MEPLLISAAVAALAEIGDKTQLLALVLASRFRRPAAIVAAILTATFVNHGLAATLGAWVARLLSPGTLRWGLGLSFFGMAAWTVMARTGEIQEARLAAAPGVFGTAAVALFLAEMGDKTQIATVALAARYGEPTPVVIGTCLGVLLADLPAVLIGCKLAQKMPVRLMQTAAGVVLALLGIATFAEATNWPG
jgi:Ca2+/H+ antiporter, TMEM165/GDT1 family